VPSRRCVVSKAVILEDDVLASMALAELLQGEGFEVRQFASTDEARAGCIGDLPDILIADWCVPGTLSSADLVAFLQGLRPDLRVIFVSGYESSELKALVDSHSRVECMSKPLHFERFLHDIKIQPTTHGV
jgi:DNA-binding response OmpR family regulator